MHHKTAYGLVNCDISLDVCSSDVSSAAYVRDSELGIGELESGE